MIETSKYNIIWKSISEPHIVTSSDSEYASYLKNLERVCSKKGYLDSKFYTQQMKRKSTQGSYIEPEVKIINHSSEIAKDRDKFKEDYEKNMKKINRSLLEEKRKERVLKRAEGEIIKKKHVLNKSLYELNSDISLKKFQQDLKLSKTADDLDKIHKKYYYDRSKTTRERMKQSIFSQIENTGKSRQSNLNISRLIREFNAKKNELDVNAKNIAKLMKEFEIKLNREETLHKKLKDELNLYSDALKKETLRNQIQEEESQKETLRQYKCKEDEDKQLENSLLLVLNQSDSGIKAAELEQKVLDSELNKKIEDHSVKMCEYGGSLNTIRNKLRESEDIQHQLIENANYFNLVLKNNEYTKKVETVNSKKTEMVLNNQNQMINDRAEKENKYSKLSINRQISLELENESENVDHLKRIIRRDKEIENKYFKGINDASKEIKRMSILIFKLSKQLQEAKELNSTRINEDQRISEKCERQMEDELKRQKTALAQLQSKRNKYSIQLVECRKYLKGDQYHLQKSNVNKTRLGHIKEKTDETHSLLPVI